MAVFFCGYVLMWLCGFVAMFFCGKQLALNFRLSALAILVRRYHYAIARVWFGSFLPLLDLWLATFGVRSARFRRCTVECSRMIPFLGVTTFNHKGGIAAVVFG